GRCPRHRRRDGCQAQSLHRQAARVLAWSGRRAGGGAAPGASARLRRRALRRRPVARSRPRGGTSTPALPRYRGLRHRVRHGPDRCCLVWRRRHECGDAAAVLLARGRGLGSGHALRGPAFLPVRADKPRQAPDEYGCADQSRHPTFARAQPLSGRKPSEHTYFDAAVMLAFLLLIGRYLDYLLRDRARGAAQHLVALQSATARRLKAGGEMETVAARELAAGDRVLLASGERAPADGLAEDATDADISLVTGESAPVTITKGEALRAGSIVVGRPIVLRTTASVDDSLVADLARLLEAGQQTRSLYVRLADRAARAYVPFVTSAALLVFAIWA